MGWRGVNGVIILFAWLLTNSAIVDYFFWENKYFWEKIRWDEFGAKILDWNVLSRLPTIFIIFGWNWKILCSSRQLSSSFSFHPIYFVYIFLSTICRECCGIPHKNKCLKRWVNFAFFFLTFHAMRKNKFNEILVDLWSISRNNFFFDSSVPNL